MAFPCLTLHSIQLLWAGHLWTVLSLTQHSQWVVAMEEMRPAGSIPFRLGSGAVAASLDYTTIDLTGTSTSSSLTKRSPLIFTDFISLPKTDRSPLIFAYYTSPSSPQKNHTLDPLYFMLKQNIDMLAGIAIMIIVFYLMPKNIAESVISLSRFLGNNQLHNKTSSWKVMNGVFPNDAAIDPGTHPPGLLQDEHSAVEKETRLIAMTKIIAFERQPDESVEQILERYEAARQRAALENHFWISSESCALQ